MKIAQELRNCLDVSMTINKPNTSLVGLGVAHWNGLRAASESQYGGAFAKLHNELAFSQAAWAVISILMVVAISIGIATRRKSNESRRLATQLFIAVGIFCVFNLVLLAFRSDGI